MENFIVMALNYFMSADYLNLPIADLLKAWEKF